MRIIPLICAILFVGISASAQNAGSTDFSSHSPSLAVERQVVEAGSGEPVEYACISNRSHTIGFLTDADGRFLLNASEIPADSIIVSRTGYATRTFSPRNIPAIIYLEESPTTLQSVTVVPKKRKTLGGMFIPNPAKKAVLDLLRKVDVTHQRTHYCESEGGRKFKFKHDSRILKIRICLDNNDTVGIIFNVYRKVDKDWVNIHDRPIVVEVPASDDWKNIVEVDVSELLEPQPKGEYMIGIAKAYGDGLTLWAGQPVLEDGRERIIGSDRWKSIDTVPGIEIEIEY